MLPVNSGIQGVAQISGPLVVGHLRLQDLVEHSGGLDVVLLGAFNAQDVDRSYAAEQQHGDQRTDHANHNRFFDTGTHEIGPPCSFYSGELVDVHPCHASPHCRRSAAVGRDSGQRFPSVAEIGKYIGII